MLRTHQHKDVTWLDLENPQPEEINQIMHSYSIPNEAAEDLLSPTPKQRVVKYDNCVYIVMHFPALSHPIAKNHQRQEIDFIIGKKFLITVHYDKIKSIDNFGESFITEIQSGLEDTEHNAGHIFHKLMRKLYHNILQDVEMTRDSLHRVENAIFKGEEKRMVIEISKIHRDILRFKSATGPHKEAITTLYQVFREFLGNEYEYFIHDMSSEYQRVERRMQANKDLLDELRLTNDSLLESKQNEAIKSLTMMAFMTFPLTLIATLFTMRTDYMPIIGMQNDFWIIIGIMFAVVISCISFFSYKKWL